MGPKLFVFMVLCTCVSDAYKILALFPYEGKSHFLSIEPLLKALARNGHQVTVLSPFPQPTPVQNLTDVDVGNVFPSTSIVDLDTFALRFQHYLIPFALAYRGYHTCTHVFSNKNFRDFMDGDPKFDLIITEIFNTECFLGIVHKLGSPPLVLISSFIMLPWQKALAMPSNPSYIHNHFQPLQNASSFVERVKNTALFIFHNLIFDLFIDLPGNLIARSYFGSELPRLSDIAANASVFLSCTHLSSSGSRPMVPGYVEVGGLHVGELGGGIPQHLEKWINESTHGVIYFSLGSMIKGHTFPEEKRQMFLRAFARFPQRILWKWETDTMPGKPENVMIDKWMPQFDILSHPNVKAFIAHGGLLGVTEAVHCGVPLIIMPQFGDQFTNAKAVEASGGGVILDYRSLDEESIYNALKTVLDPSFNKKAKELSARFRDRPMPPLETAIYWVEYVARHGGAPHLRTAAVGMPLYQYLLLDVIAFLAVVLLTIMYISFIVTRAIFRRIFKTNKVEKVKKN